MAAYGALVSVMQIIDQLQQHPRPPITLYKKQAESLTEKVTFLQDFLEHYSHVNSKEVDELEGRIADAGYAAEDVIESHIVDQIHAGSTNDHGGKHINFVHFYFYQDLNKVIQDLDSIKKQALKIKEKLAVQQDQLHTNSTISAGSASTGQKKIEMVGFHDILIEMMDNLTRGQPDRQILPIVGMGGSGKTTLARNITEHKVVTQHFDIIAWGDISQEYSLRKILVEILGDKCGGEDELKIKLHQKLWGRRYLIVLDDIWDIEVWHQLNNFFPNDKKGSRIIVTTRMSSLASQLTNSYRLEMTFLNGDESWDLFCKIVFGEEGCPPDLHEIGKIIVINCRGLALSIVVIGGVLAKSEKKQKYWEHIAGNLNSIVNLEDNERCLQILYTSYNSLPIHLKPCFLFIGACPKNTSWVASKLIKIWIAEGFLKPIDGKCLEDVGEEYLKQLLDRNLISVVKYTFTGRIKICRIHDILRELCSREAQKHKFFCVNMNGKDIHTARRINIIRSGTEKKYSAQTLDALQTASLNRSLSWEFEEPSPSINARLLRVSVMQYGEENGQVSSLEPIFQQVNLRYLDVISTWDTLCRSVPSFSLFWNLQTLFLWIAIDRVILAPFVIWKLPLLRHIQMSKFKLPDPRTRSHGGDENIVLKNPHTLKGPLNLKYSEEVVKRIPNIKKLYVSYDEKDVEADHYCLDNIGHLQKLEALHFGGFVRSRQHITFPHSLKKLFLGGSDFKWEDVTTKIGSLPLLEILALTSCECIGSHWETVVGQFCRLKLLIIAYCDLEHWTTDSTHFPRLERLFS